MHISVLAAVTARRLSIAACGLLACACTKKTPATVTPGEHADGTSPVSATGVADTAVVTVSRAQVSIAPLGENKVSGTLVITELPDGAGVRIEGALAGLTPGEHGMHVHEKGDCSAADGMSAGGHFNPTAAPHGAVSDAKSHVGDFGNIVADKEGRAAISIIKPAATLKDGPSSLVGHSIIVHAKADDLHSQPAGDAGGRIACGIVQSMR